MSASWHSTRYSVTPRRLCESSQQLHPQDLPVKGECDMQHGGALHLQSALHTSLLLHVLSFYASATSMQILCYVHG